MAGQEGFPGSSATGESGGRTRGGARRAPKPRRTLRPDLAATGAGAFVALVAWGLLVWVAIGLGRDARAGESGRWVWLVLVSLGAALCLFGCLWLVTVSLRRVGILEQQARGPRPPHRH